MNRIDPICISVRWAITLKLGPGDDADLDCEYSQYIRIYDVYSSVHVQYYLLGLGMNCTVNVNYLFIIIQYGI